ncbi:CLUMA_CG020435, isoform A [Clunio marinus]|uniref:CLUMA_CG020435, isoform A n=1 Tax=Clunio marinus TaxID=568069 RepID=A0A1J1J4Y2_9DIPT|nr:CLUMA_CG020435, isoform A [Clunio marinus]
MSENLLSNCRLCNYQCDKRLMLNIFDESSGYSEKIESYLSLKVFSTDNSSHVCFHCSQTLDNFHNFATKIKAIQKIIYPEQFQIQEIAYEICVFPQPEANIENEKIDADENFEEVVYQPLNKNNHQHKEIKISSTIRTRSKRERNENFFDNLLMPTKVIKKAPEKVEEEQTSYRSFDFEENHQSIKIDQNDSSCSEVSEETNSSEWPSAHKTKNIPSQLVSQNGLLIYKGKKLMRMMSSFYNANCESCGSKYKRLNDLFTHYEISHECEPFVTCCQIKLTKLPRMIWHFVKHIQPELFKCNICSYIVSRPKFLQLHLQTHSTTAERPYSCDKCDKRFIWKGALKSHLINHQPEAERKVFLCLLCNRKYQSAGSLASHKKATHGDNSAKTRNLCEICSKSFSTITSYKEHMITHSKDSVKLQLKCEECGKWLKNNRCLKSHMLLHANIDYKCTICDYVTKKEKLLKNHVITRHTSDRPWTCEECNKSFKIKRALAIHKRQSHGVEAIKGKTCEFCGRKFANASNYYTHRKNFHSKDLQSKIDKKNEEEQMKRIKIGLETSSSNIVGRSLVSGIDN